MFHKWYKVFNLLFIEWKYIFIVYKGLIISDYLSFKITRF